MKYRGLFIILFALVLTWNLFVTQAQVDLKTHTTIQNHVSQIIRDAVDKKYNDISSIQFNKIWTETINSKKIKVTFDYKIELNNFNNETMAGFAFLKKIGVDEWLVESITGEKNTLSFSEGIIINVPAN